MADSCYMFIFSYQTGPIPFSIRRDDFLLTILFKHRDQDRDQCNAGYHRGCNEVFFHEISSLCAVINCFISMIHYIETAERLESRRV